MRKEKRGAMGEGLLPPPLHNDCLPRRGVPDMKQAEHAATKSRMGSPASIIASVVALIAAATAPDHVARGSLFFLFVYAHWTR